MAFPCPLVSSRQGLGDRSKCLILRHYKGVLDVPVLLESRHPGLDRGPCTLLTLAVACATAATPIPVPTDTPVPTATPTPNTGNWEQDVSKDLMNDTSTLLIGLQASESTLEPPYEDPMMMVACPSEYRGEGLVLVVINWDKYLGPDNPKVDWRVNSESPTTTRWLSVGDIGTAHFKPNEAVADLRACSH